MRNNPSKTKHKTKRTGVVLLALLVFLAWFWYFENYTFAVTKTEIRSDKVSAPLTIVQLTDLHGAVFGQENRNLIRAVEKQAPDLICVTGDMYTNGDTAGMDTAIQLMAALTETAPVYFVPGEHDQGEEYLALLATAGVQVISYQKVPLRLKGNDVTLYGINNVYYTDTFNLFREFDKPSADSYSILLAHIPNFDAFNWFGPDLTLCGDTHGGVAQIPFFGPAYCNDRWFPKLSRKDGEYIIDKGLFSTYTGHLYVSGGLGNYPAPLRLFNRPEISVLTVLPKGGNP